VRIGLTYNLRAAYRARGFSEEETAEFDRPDTIAAIEAALRRLGHATQRIGAIEDLAKRLTRGQRWDLVFNIAEGLGGFAREAQVPALLEAYGIACTFSDPMVMALTLHKGLTKRVVRDAGVPTADFAAIESPADLAACRLPFPVFAKPIAEGTGRGISTASRIRDRRELGAVVGGLLRRYRQPVLVERYLPGREFTVGLVGAGARARAIGVLEVGLKDPGREYGYAEKEDCESLVRYGLVEDREAKAAARVALAAWRALGCRDAGRIDLRSDANRRPHFLEVNPLPGLHPEHSDLPILCTQAGFGYDRLIAAIVSGAASRRRSDRARVVPRKRR